MGFAYITKDGDIRLAVNKVSPFERLQEGERLATYNLPEVDNELYAVSPVIPVTGDSVEFTIEERPDILDKVKLNKNKVVQNYLDTKARERGYDSIISAVSYSSDATCPFYNEGISFSRWRSSCWVKAFEVLNPITQVSSMPSDEELINSLPLLQL
jgi:hypothetical protein